MKSAPQKRKINFFFAGKIYISKSSLIKKKIFWGRRGRAERGYSPPLNFYHSSMYFMDKVVSGLGKKKKKPVGMWDQGSVFSLVAS